MAAPIDLLGQYREKDEKTPQGETLPERETLNNARLRDYMDKHGFTAENFDTRFNVQTALEILQSGGTKGENEMITAIKTGQEYFVKIGEPELIQRTNEASFNSTLEKELRRRNELQLQPKLQRAYLTYHTVRKLCERTLKIQKQFSEKRKGEQISTEKGISETIAGVYEDVKKNYNKMNGTEKLIAVGGLIFGAAMLLSESENEKVQWVKDKLWTALKIGGMGVGFNYVFKLATGKTALDSVSDWSKGTVAKDTFWGETFKTTPENGALIQKSTVYLGERDFLDLAKQYKEAKASGQNEMVVSTVNATDMSPKEIFTACDSFFKIYPVETLEPKYRKAKTRQTWLNVVSASMIEDGRLDIEGGNLAQRALDGMQEYGVRGWNGFWVTTEGTGLMRYLYLKARGTDPTDMQLTEGVDKLRKQVENEVTSEGELDSFFDKNMSPDSAKQYKKLLVEGKRDSKDANVKSYEVAGDSIYIMSEAKLDGSLASEKAVGQMLNKALKQAEDYIKRTYPDAADNVYKFVNIDEIRGVRVAENSTFKLFVRMPAKGSAEFSRKAVLATPATLRDEKHGAELFGEGSKLEYGKMDEWDKQKFRINFLLDASQAAEIDKICQWYAQEYKGKSMTREAVMKILLTDEKVRDKAVEQTGIKQNLKSGADRLKGEWEGKLQSIEKSAASKFEGSDAFNTLQEQMKRHWGYNVRLLILGDVSVFDQPEFQQYNPKVSTEGGWFTKSNFEKLLADYETRCKQMVTDYKGGKV